MELGFWRPQPDGGLEVVSAHANGVIEIEIGTVADDRIELVSRTVASAPTAKDVSRVERTFEIAGDVLTYEVRMAAVGQPIGPHLHAQLTRRSS
jgi:hypothetical protein